MLLVGAALASTMKPANQPHDATPGREIMPIINRRDAASAAASDANVQAAALAAAATPDGVKVARCMARLASFTDRMCPNLAMQSSVYEADDASYCGPDCQNAGDAAFAEEYAKAMETLGEGDPLPLETKTVTYFFAQLVAMPADGGPQEAASSSGKGKKPIQARARVGLQSLHQHRNRGIGARVLMPVALVLQSKAVGRLLHH